MREKGRELLSLRAAGLGRLASDLGRKTYLAKWSGAVQVVVVLRL